MKLQDVIDNAKITEAPEEYFAVREIYRDNINHPSFRLRCLPLVCGDVSLESDEGDGYRLTKNDLDADDWLILPNEEISGRAA